MKRARAVPADYDPVYPYDKPDANTQPPYFNRKQGLTETPPGTLAVNAAPPIAFNTFGALKLNTGAGLALADGKLQANVGEGLTLNNQGQITLDQNSGALLFDPPLQKNDKTVSLNLGDGLQNDNGQLKVNFPPPLTFTQPLTATNNAVSLNIGNGLETNGGRLQVVFPPPPSPPPPLTFTQPLTLNNNTVALTLGDGLATDNGRLKVNFPAPPTPLTFSGPLSSSNNTVSLNVGSGLQVNSSALEVKPLTYQAPLQKTDQTVSLQLGSGLTVNNNQLTVVPPPATQYSPPLVKNGNSVSLQVGTGLEVQNNALVARALTFNAPLTSSNNAVSLNLGGGLAVTNGALGLKIGSSLNLVNGTLEVTTPSVGPSVTLWTGPSPSINGVINNSPLIRCFVCLAREQSMVTLTAWFKGESYYSTVSRAQVPFSLTMEFDQFGQLMSTGNINSTSTWGEKPWANNSVQAHPSHTWKLCMPNPAVYPSSSPRVFLKKLGLDTIANEAGEGRNIDCLIILNKKVTAISTYAISFRFLNFTRLPSATNFISDVINCSFVGENQN
ncbi:fiber protein [bat adenovirus 3]|uniref:Fiber protein n=1 Tax=bat adenovirus 3 TaxID=2758098 RepID=D3X7D1_9ADEN|nr:fiber protein [bat adenovirus 3]ADD17120.1 fiber protein [bat adenovirus 3]